MNEAAMIGARARGNGWLDRPAYFADGRVWNHGDVHSLAARLATVLADSAVRPGHRVLIALPDRPDLVSLFLGVGRLGAVAVVVNPQLIAGDYAAIIELVRPALTVSEDDLEAVFSPACWKSIDHLVRSASSAETRAAIQLEGAAPLYVQFTSGTTGMPKGAVHRHRDLAAYHRAVGAGMLDLRPHDVSLSISKMFFAYGFGNSLVYPLCSGSSAVLTHGRAIPKMVESLVEEFGVTVLYAVPSAYANLVCETHSGAFRSIRAAVSAGESLPVSLGAKASRLLGVDVLNELGSTEVGGAFCSNTPGDNVPGTVGRPLRDYELQVRDDSGQVLGEEIPGRLWVRGPTIMSGYLNLPEVSRQVLVGGWLCTNDTAVLRSDGRLTHTGRVDDVEFVGGINVSPHEVEAVLIDHPSVREVVVAAVPDERGATKLRAFVVPVTGEEDKAALEAELLALGRRRLAPFKVPRSVTFVPALPRTFTGKVQRFKVRQGAW